MICPDVLTELLEFNIVSKHFEKVEHMNKDKLNRDVSH
jgi:hypothetical protein